MSSILAQIEMGMPNVLPGTDVHICLRDTSTHSVLNYHKVEMFEKQFSSIVLEESRHTSALRVISKTNHSNCVLVLLKK